MDAYYKTDCIFCGNDYCKTLNAVGCDACLAKNLSTEELQTLRTNIDAVRGLLPRGNVSELFESETCLLCKGDKHKKNGYALTDFAHKEPEHEHRNVIGMKVKSRVGSIVPLQIACCDRCKRNVRYVNNITFFVSVIGIGAALALVGIQGIREPLEKIHEMLPFGIFAAISMLSVVLGKLASILAFKKRGINTILDINEIPFIAEMREAGWFCATQNSSNSEARPRLIFTKERLKRGWFS